MEEEKKLYIGNLEYGVDDEQLRQFITEKGIEAKEVRVINDKYSGRSKGFGFAEFDTAEQAQQAIDALNGQELNGRPLRVNKAMQRQARPDRGDRGGRFGGGAGRPDRSRGDFSGNSL